MPKLKKQLTFETTFGTYIVDEILGEGGAGRVFGGIGPDDAKIALKVLTDEHASKDKRRRFKNEISFLSRTRHPNLVAMIDHGVARGQKIEGPFYVMPRYDGSLRDVMAERVAPEAILSLFSQIIDGVEAAHLNRVIHRDLKPENILYDRVNSRLAIADFGIAQFTESMMATLVETSPSQRLANFQYAAPEQRAIRADLTVQTDIYALGLILNELFTGEVPHGTLYRQITAVDPRFAFLDPLVARMLAQSPLDRPASIAEVKGLIQRYDSEAVALQRIRQIDGTIIKADVVDEPLADAPPQLVGADWDRGRLTLLLDRPVSAAWVQALHNMGNYSAVMGKPPASFSFNGKNVTADASEHEVQLVLDYFKSWLPLASSVLRQSLQSQIERENVERRERLRREREEEERRLRVLQKMRI